MDDQQIKSSHAITSNEESHMAVSEEKRPIWKVFIKWNTKLNSYIIQFQFLYFIWYILFLSLFIDTSIVFNLEFSPSIYWELNYEFNLVFHLIRTFHISLFFWRCHMAFFIWCCHVAWFHSLIVHIINLQKLNSQSNFLSMRGFFFHWLSDFL